MKNLGLKLLVGGALIATFSFTSCKSNGYGCDYGAHETIEEIQTPETLEIDEAQEAKVSYTKYSKE